MKKRLRKKLYRGEFQVLGFTVDCKWAEEISNTALDELLDDFLDQVVEIQDLLFGGGCDRTHLSGFITAAGRYSSPTEENRTRIEACLAARPEVAQVIVGSLEDAWYEHDDRRK